MLVYDENSDSNEYTRDWMDGLTGSQWFARPSKATVRVLNGFLVMTVKEENQIDSRFTGAQLISRRPFASGKIEIRAIQPNGKGINTEFTTLMDVYLSLCSSFSPLCTLVHSR